MNHSNIKVVLCLDKKSQMWHSITGIKYYFRTINVIPKELFDGNFEV